tara:strand:- start:8704 stop:10086 length:1383 start_codon:yes stop_codon:yes gene_type:complete
MTNLSNIKIFTIIFLSALFIFISFFLFFQVDPQELFICDIYLEQKISVGTNELNFLYPHSRCDDEIYLGSVQSFQSIFSESNNQYQNRPLYLISNYLTYKFFGIFINPESSSYDFLPALSFFITQILFFAIGIYILIKVLSKYYEISIFNIMSITVIASLNPLLQFGIFTPSNQTLSTLVFIISLYLLEKKDLKKNLFVYALFLGLLFLLNRSFFIGIISVNFYLLLKSRRSFRNLINNFISVLIFFIPNFLYKQYLNSQNILPYDMNTEYYGQFIWLSKYFDSGLGYWFTKILLPKKLFDLRLTQAWDTTDEWFCFDLPKNFYCYGVDSLNLIKYLLIPVVLLILVKIVNRNKDQIYKKVILVGGFSYLFWSLIGWYPPIRFSLYSLGNLIFIMLIIEFLKLKKFNERIFYLFTLLFSLFHISHWNDTNYLNFDYFDYFSIFTLIYLIWKLQYAKTNNS